MNSENTRRIRPRPGQFQEALNRRRHRCLSPTGSKHRHRDPDAQTHTQTHRYTRASLLVPKIVFLHLLHGLCVPGVALLQSDAKLIPYSLALFLRLLQVGQYYGCLILLVLCTHAHRHTPNGNPNGDPNCGTQIAGPKYRDPNGDQSCCTQICWPFLSRHSSNKIGSHNLGPRLGSHLGPAIWVPQFGTPMGSP